MADDQQHDPIRVELRRSLDTYIVTRRRYPLLVAAERELQLLQRAYSRFRDSTEALDGHRNRVRAHRFEKTFDASFLQSLPALGGQAQYMDNFLRDAAHVLTRDSYHLETDYTPAGRWAARDFADLVVHGSIHRATIAYGLSPQPTAKDPTPWYRNRRERWLAESPLARGDDDA